MNNMITVTISINGNPVITRSAVNRLREKGVYISDDGSEIEHNPEDGAIPLAIKMLERVIEIK
jgi:hypothetical protein